MCFLPGTNESLNIIPVNLSLSRGKAYFNLHIYIYIYTEL